MRHPARTPTGGNKHDANVARATSLSDLAAQSPELRLPTVGAAPSNITSVYRWYVLTLLTVVYALNVADRLIMSTLTEPIKAALHLSDSAVALLSGTATGLLYATVGIPLSAVADRSNRSRMIALSLCAWSLLTAACGAVHSFAQLLFARLGVGIAEAGGTPPSHSLVADYFPRRERAIALTIFSTGASLGAMLGSSAGYVADSWGWRLAFIVLGPPGVLLALLVWKTVREPVRGCLEPTPTVRTTTTFAQTLAYAYRQPALRHCLLGATLFSLWASGLQWWTPSFLIRSHHLTLSQASTTLLLIHGVGGTTCLLVTAAIMRCIAYRDERLVPRFAATAIAVAAIPSLLAYLTSVDSIAIGMLWIFISLSYAVFGPTFALIQNLVPPDMRAKMVALLLLLSNVANLVVAPQLVGFVSDALAPRLGVESLRTALAPFAFVGFAAAVHYWCCANHLRSELRHQSRNLQDAP